MKAILNRLGISGKSDNQAAIIFESLFPDFMKVSYKKPSEYISKYWNAYQKSSYTKNIGFNGKIFEYIIATLLIREELLPLYFGAKVAFVPNVNYDLLLYSSERGPICLSAKTSLRERYKQADLEAIALKYVHRKSLSYLLTLSDEALLVKKKITSGDVIGLDDVIIVNQPEFDDLIISLKKYTFSEPPTVKIIDSNLMVTRNKVESIYGRV